MTVLRQLQCHTIGSHHFCISSNLYNENFQKNSSHRKEKTLTGLREGQNILLYIVNVMQSVFFFINTITIGWLTATVTTNCFVCGQGFIQSFQTCLGITLRTCKAGFGRLLSSTNWNPPLHNFYRFLQVSTGCKLVANHFDRPISYIFSPVPANLFFIVMTTSQDFGHW